MKRRKRKRKREKKRETNNYGIYSIPLTSQIAVKFCFLVIRVFFSISNRLIY